MTIEKTIQDLTLAVQDLTKVLSLSLGHKVEMRSEDEVKELRKAKEPKTTDAEIVPEETKPEAPKPKKAAAKVETPKVEEDLAGEAEITADVLRERTTTLGAAKGRGEVIKLLAKYGAKKGSEVAVDKRAAYVAEINKALGV